MKKKYVLIFCMILLLWFFLDMVGVDFGGKYLVTRSFTEDGIYFIIYLTALVLFIFKEKIGKYILDAWLLLWFATQFISHWLYTLTGRGSGKIEYFKDSLKIFESRRRYIPDAYHIVLHLLIITAFVSLNIYMVKNKKRKSVNEQ